MVIETALEGKAKRVKLMRKHRYDGEEKEKENDRVSQRGKRDTRR